MTQPADREAVALCLFEWIGYMAEDKSHATIDWAQSLSRADAILSRWRLVPVEDAPELDGLRTILTGIDDDEGDGDGWWETSGGMDFGADKLAEVLTWGQRALGLPVTDNHVHRWVDYQYQMTGREFRYSCRCGAETNDANH